MSYSIRPLGKICSETGDPLVPGGVCYSMLRFVDGELKRFDIGEAAWTGPPEDAFGWWRTRVPEAASGPKPLDPDALLLTLEEMTEEASPGTERLRYVLALHLLQKRRVTIEAVREEDGSRFLTLVGSRSEGPLEVRDLQLPDDEVASIMAEFRGMPGDGADQTETPYQTDTENRS